MSLVLATGRGLLIARRALRWSVDAHLDGRSVECVTADPLHPSLLYGGTLGRGLWRSGDGGRTWEPAGAGIAHADVTSVAVSPAEGGDAESVVYAGTEPSAIFRSTDGGRSWTESPGLRTLPSASTWSFPPRPDTHHVRWLEPDPVTPGRVYAAIEAGALVRTTDGGRTWDDRVPGGPYDTHTAAAHRLAPGRLWCAAGDGYFETHDAGRTWSHGGDGLRHRYLVGIAVGAGDPDTVIVSGADGPWTAYDPPHAEAYVYRRAAPRAWERAMEGLPAAEGTSVSRFTAHPDEPGVIYAANNRGVFRTHDGGRAWTALDIPWPDGALADGVEALAAFVE